MEAKTHLKNLITRYPQLLNCQNDIQVSFDSLLECFTFGNKLLLAGNGGSAADAEHISGELLKGFGSPRTITGDERNILGPELANKLQGSLPAIPLSSFTSLLSAWGNDCDPDYNFAQLTYGLGNPDDVLLAISTSGNSRNVLHALEVAAAIGLKTIGLSGKTGGAMKSRVDTCICVPETEVFKIQELHLPVYHTLCLMLETAFFDD